MRRLLPLLLLTLLSACASQAPRHAGTAVSEVRDFNDLAQIAPALAESPKRTLLVLDIDDTLLTSPGFFGSDTWYEWQAKTLQPGDPDKLACLFDVVSLNYEAGNQRPTQPDGPALINALPVDKLMLTSRNRLYRGGTLRTLHDAGYALPTPLGGQAEGAAWAWRKAPGARETRMDYDQGILMTAGQDKGLVLLALLQRLRLHYGRVLLVDDGEKNINDMRAALRDAGIAYLGLHYTRVDKRVGPEQIQAGRAGWQAWRQLLASTYPLRLQNIEHGHCGY